MSLADDAGIGPGGRMTQEQSLRVASALADTLNQRVAMLAALGVRPGHLLAALQETQALIVVGAAGGCAAAIGNLCREMDERLRRSVAQFGDLHGSGRGKTRPAKPRVRRGLDPQP